MFLRNYINCGQFHRKCNFLCGAVGYTSGSDFTLENQASRERKHYSCDFRGVHANLRGSIDGDCRDHNVL